MHGALPDNSQNAQETDIYASGGFEATFPASELPQTQALESEAAGIGTFTRWKYV